MRSSISASCFILALASGGIAPRDARAQEPAAAVKDPKLNFRENGRIGVAGAITEDGWKGGIIFEHEHFEAQILGHYDYQNKDTHDARISYKVGGRMPLGTLNYLAFGFEFGHHPGGREGGASLSSDYILGPYVSLQRYFAATPIMLLLWVNPVQYDHAVEVVDGVGTATPTWRVFQTGGFGLGYLF
jgi:hypothetical protein